MNIAIVDDMESDRINLERVLNEYASIHGLDTVISSFSRGAEFISEFTPHMYTVIFMDIYMDGMTGIEAAKKIREADDYVFIVFMTTSEEHRAEAFECYASAYIVKPFESINIYRIMDHMLRLRTDEGEERRFFFSSSRHNYSLRFSEIVSITAEKNYIIITDAAGNIYRTRMRVSEAEETFLHDRRFLLINRGIIVNLDFVVQVTEKLCRLKGDVVFPINIKKKDSIQNIWYNYNFEKLRREEIWEEGQ